MNLDFRCTRLNEIYQCSVRYGGGSSAVDGDGADGAKGQEVSRRQKIWNDY